MKRVFEFRNIVQCRVESVRARHFLFGASCPILIIPLRNLSGEFEDPMHKTIEIFMLRLGMSSQE